MPKRQTNNLRWSGNLMAKQQIKNSNDKIITTYTKTRILRYEEIGTTATEKYQSKQAKTEVVKRIKIRFDKSINEKTNAVEIDSILYDITRIYSKQGKEMELSLAYVD
ncbi:MAG: phage head closure protein [Enterococcus lemanii]